MAIFAHDTPNGRLLKNHSYFISVWYLKPINVRSVSFYICLMCIFITGCMYFLKLWLSCTFNHGPEVQTSAALPVYSLVIVISDYGAPWPSAPHCPWIIGPLVRILSFVFAQNCRFWKRIESHSCSLYCGIRVVAIVARMGFGCVQSDSSVIDLLPSMYQKYQ